METGWEKHLFQAIVGEILSSAAKSGIENYWDDAVKLLLLECERISYLYHLHFSTLVVEVIKLLDNFVGEKEKPIPHELMN